MSFDCHLQNRTKKAQKVKESKPYLRVVSREALSVVLWCGGSSSERRVDTGILNMRR